MEKYQESLDLAIKKFKVADHMINMTYPLVRDTKLLLVALENLFLAYTGSMSALLYYERLYKRIPPFNPTFDSKYFLYSRTCQQRFNLDRSHSIIMKEIKDTMVEHKKSPVVFSKKDKLVICSDSYSTKVLTYPKIKEYLNKAKLFIEEIKSIIYERQLNGRTQRTQKS